MHSEIHFTLDASRVASLCASKDFCVVVCCATHRDPTRGVKSLMNVCNRRVGLHGSRGVFVILGGAVG